MNNLITKKYVKALMLAFNEKEILLVDNLLEVLNNSFQSKKFKTILFSPDIKKIEKVKFVISLLENPDKKFINFIKLLGENGRLGLISDIYFELKLQISFKNNVYNGKVISDSLVSKEQIANLEKSFSRKFNATIKLSFVESSYQGIKVELDSLGVESSLSLDRLKTQMSEYILKAI